MNAEFEERGIPKFNYAVYDMFYAGYGDTVPAMGFNSAGMTFEKTSGHPTPRRVFEQYLTQWISLSQAAINKEEILEGWHDSWVEAERQGEAGKLEPNFTVEPGNEVLQQVPDMRVRHYFLRPEQGKARELQSLVRRLQRMDVTVKVLTRSLRVPDYRPYGRAARGTTLPAGTIWIPMAQRQKHWIQSMLNESTYTPVGYAYDVVGWSQPLLFNVDGGFSGERLSPRAVTMPRLPEAARPRVPRNVEVALWSMSPQFTRGIESSGWLRWLLDDWGVEYREVTAADIRAGGLEGADVLLVPDGYALDDGSGDPYGYGDLGAPGRRGAAGLGDRRRALRRLARRRRARLGGRHVVGDIPGRRRRRRLDAGQPVPRARGHEQPARRGRRAVRVAARRRPLPDAGGRVAHADALPAGRLGRLLRLRAGRRRGGDGRHGGRGRRAVRVGPGRGVQLRPELPRVHRRDAADAAQRDVRRRSEHRARSRRGRARRRAARRGRPRGG